MQVHAKKHCREWTAKERKDVTEVVMVTSRDDTGVSYEVHVALRSLAASAYEEGEDRLVVWTKRVDFGSTDAACAGGALFLQAAHLQQEVADEITAVVWGPRD